MSHQLLLDEMFSDAIAQELCGRAHDVLAVVAGPALVALPDEQILAHAASTGRGLVNARIKNIISPCAGVPAAGRAHAGLILVHTKTFPQDRTYTSAVTKALSALLDQPNSIHGDQVLFLARS